MKEKNKITNLVSSYKRSKRTAISKRFPFLKKEIIFLRYATTNIKNFLNLKIKHKKQKYYFNHVVAKHQSVLRRKLGDSDPKLQEQKIINIKQAIKKLDGIVIKPNNIFSFWKIIGKPSYKKGYVNGMLLSDGKIIEGVGGGLCQLSNFIYWIFLHAPTKTIQRYHHSMDVFPDSGRVLPFGSGATVLYNFIDLKIKNISKHSIQLKIWVTEKHLKGQILSPRPINEKFHIFEKNRFFIKDGNQYFRYNEIYRETKVNGKITKTEKSTTNFAPVLYKMTKKYLQKNNYRIINLSNKKI